MTGPCQNRGRNLSESNRSCVFGGGRRRATGGGRPALRFSHPNPPRASLAAPRRPPHGRLHGDHHHHVERQVLWDHPARYAPPAKSARPPRTPCARHDSHGVLGRRNTGGESAAAPGEIPELKAELLSTDKKTKVAAMKKVIANMTLGNDMSALFPEVLGLMQTPILELKKMVYHYVITYAKLKPELALLCVNSFIRVRGRPRASLTDVGSARSRCGGVRRRRPFRLGAGRERPEPAHPRLGAAHHGLHSRGQDHGGAHGAAAQVPQGANLRRPARVRLFVGRDAHRDGRAVVATRSACSGAGRGPVRAQDRGDQRREAV